MLVAKDAPEPFPLDGSEPHAHMVSKGIGERGNVLTTCDGKLTEWKPRSWRDGHPDEWDRLAIGGGR